MKKFEAWILAIRFKTLSASLVPVFVATALVKMEKGLPLVSPLVLIFSLLSAFLIQIGTNLINDALDFRKGKDTKDRIGPLRVSVVQALSDRVVLRVGFFCFFLALLCGVPLVFIGGWPIFWLGIFSLIFGYLYTGGPFPLAYVGLGEVFVFLFFGIFSVGGVYYLHTLSLSFSAFLTGLQMGCLCNILLAVNHLRDIEEDRKTHKKTLSVRFGVSFSRLEILFFCGFSFILNLFWVLRMKTLPAFLPFFVFPFFCFLVFQIFKTPPSRKYNAYLARGSVFYVLFGFLLSLGFWMS